MYVLIIMILIRFNLDSIVLKEGAHHVFKGGEVTLKNNFIRAKSANQTNKLYTSEA